MMNGKPTLTVAQSMEMARRHFSTGTLEDAAMISLRVLEVEPKNPDLIAFYHSSVSFQRHGHRRRSYGSGAVTPGRPRLERPAGSGFGGSDRPMNPRGPSATTASASHHAG